MKKQPITKFLGFPPEPTMDFWCYPKILNDYWSSLSGSEQKILDYILRHTWGFNKTCDEISPTQLEGGIKNFDRGTGLSRPTIVEAIKGLIEKSFIKKTRGKKANRYEIVKDFNYSSKKSLSFDGKENLHTINNIAIDNKQYEAKSKKAYFRGDPMVYEKSKKKWFVINKYNEWLEFVGKNSEIEWK